ncbi:hypothetical protein [Serinicoccus sp. CUA-874]|uniref:hypothetical protein n=1 Tax=Serinicoccus sp. CUA-874 TaxID=1517939 RepID=UPI001EDB7FB0|nr:hypothetical protein [Serinicoccus sp. CUA-874]
MVELFEPVDDHDRRLALTATGPLRDFNAAGLLTAADVHVATGLARAAGEKDVEVVLAAAVATRAVRSGSVAVDLAALATEGALALPDLPWPDPERWTATWPAAGWPPRAGWSSTSRPVWSTSSVTTTRRSRWWPTCGPEPSSVRHRWTSRCWQPG